MSRSGGAPGYTVLDGNALVFVDSVGGAQLAEISCVSANVINFEGSGQDVPADQTGVATGTDPDSVATRGFVETTLASDPSLVRTAPEPQVLQGNVWIQDTTQSATATEGCLRLSGGLGVAKDVTCAGDVRANSFITTSDVRLKGGVAPIADALSQVQRVRPIRYRLLSDPSGRERYGVSAQQLVTEAGLANLITPGVSDGFLGVDYTSLTGLLLRSTQQLASRVERLECELVALRGAVVRAPAPPGLARTKAAAARGELKEVK